MSFGDVLLSESQVRTGPDGGDLSPGAGGWPTIRYFNKATGYDGHAYDKKTDKAMCDELGDEEMMEAYVTDIGGATLCAVRPRTPELSSSGSSQRLMRRHLVLLHYGPINQTG